MIIACRPLFFSSVYLIYLFNDVILSQDDLHSLFFVFKYLSLSFEIIAFFHVRNLL
jgi:hypothetical protein